MAKLSGDELRREILDIMRPWLYLIIVQHSFGVELEEFIIFFAGNLSDLKIVYVYVSSGSSPKQMSYKITIVVLLRRRFGKEIHYKLLWDWS